MSQLAPALEPRIWTTGDKRRFLPRSLAMAIYGKSELSFRQKGGRPAREAAPCVVSGGSATPFGKKRGGVGMSVTERAASLYSMECCRFHIKAKTLTECRFFTIKQTKLKFDVRHPDSQGAKLRRDPPQCCTHTQTHSTVVHFAIPKHFFLYLFQSCSLKKKKKPSRLQLKLNEISVSEISASVCSIIPLRRSSETDTGGACRQTLTCKREGRAVFNAV